MRNIDFFQGRRVTIIGLGVTGFACAKLLHNLQAQVKVTDNQDNPAIRQFGAELVAKGLKIEIGRHSREFFAESDLLVVSPGVPDTNPVITWALKAGIPALSEIEIAWMLCPAEVIAITGSGGKTTVTTLIAKVIEASGRKVFACGNIGNAFCSEVEKMGAEDLVALEVSSFQLKRIKDFKPKIALMLNFSKNHLDWHKDMREYLEAKKRIFLNQDSFDFLLINQLDPELKRLGREAKSKVIFFSADKEFNPNQAAVLAVAKVLGIKKDICAKAFAEFRGLEHRMEYCGEIGGVRFINDSKATLAESTLWALENISTPVILIAGGRDKGAEYAKIIPAARSKVKQVILVGEAKEKIRQALGESLVIGEADTLEEAVKKAYQQASPGDCVLLSPMCSSFDMFKNYAERGNLFKQAVAELSKNSSL